MSAYVVRVTTAFNRDASVFVSEDALASWPVPGKFGVGGLSGASRMTAAEAVAAVVLVREHLSRPWFVEAVQVDLDGYSAGVEP